LVLLTNEEKLVVPILYLHQIDGEAEYEDLSEDDQPEPTNGTEEDGNNPREKQSSSSGNGKNSKKRKREEGEEAKDKSKHRRKEDQTLRKNTSQKDSDTKKSCPSQSPPLWVRHSIHVKIRNKTMRGGAYYSKRAWIIDILPGGNCSVRIDGTGEILDNVRQEDLETIVPGEGGRVVVVIGELKGELGKVVEKEPQREKVHVQMDSDLELVTFNLDDVAEVATSH